MLGILTARGKVCVLILGESGDSTGCWLMGKHPLCWIQFLAPSKGGLAGLRVGDNCSRGVLSIQVTSQVLSLSWMGMGGSQRTHFCFSLLPQTLAGF